MGPVHNNSTFMQYMYSHRAARDGVATQCAQGDARRTTAAHVEQTRLQGRCGLDGFVRRRARLRSRNLVG